MSHLAKPAAALLALLALSAHAKFANPTEPLPADRMIKNARAFIAAHPGDAQGYYVLARLHAMAFAYGPELSVIKPPDDKSLPAFAAFQPIQVQRTDRPLTPEDLEHLYAALTGYATATVLDSTNPLFFLGRAATNQEIAAHAAWQLLDLHREEPLDARLDAVARKNYEDAARDLASPDSAAREAATTLLQRAMPASSVFLKNLRDSKDPEVKARVDKIAANYWQKKALEAYREAYILALPKDLQRPNRGPGANSLISAEAGEAILQITKAQPDLANPDEEKEITATLQKVGGAFAITPILFNMPNRPQPAQLADLLNPNARVHFDLAGDNIPRTWPWLQPGTSLLVWDPRHSGQISSGRQLFGSCTWWIFFRNGYDALALLDDNHDGKLSGPELDGIAIWTDLNGNAISDPGEVQSATAAGITEIYTHPAPPSADNTLSASPGITFTTGQHVRTFDWITEPAPDRSTSSAADRAIPRLP